MDRPSFGLVVLAATASLAIACSSAYADAADTPSESGTATTAQIPQDDLASTLPGGVSPDEGTPDGDDLAPQVEEPEGDGTQEVGSSEEAGQPLASMTGGEPSAPSADSGPSAPAPQNTGDATAKQEIEEPPAAPSGPPPAAASPVATAAPSSPPPAGQTPPPAGQTSAPATSTPVAPTTPTRTGPVAEAVSVTATTQAADRLKQLLTEVGRELRTAQGQIDGLRRALDRGAPPPPSRLTRLRATLVRITPRLAALEVRVDAAGPLSPHLRQLLHRVRGDLRGVRAAAAGLVVALGHSGARGDVLRLLLRELEAFKALASTLASTPGVHPAPAAPATSPADTQLQAAPASSPVAAPPKPPHPRVGDHRGSPPRDAGAPSAESLPSAAPGGAAASPGGSFSFAAAVALTMALIGLALPALLARLDLPPGRGYAALLIAPLERPG
jgi:hypothetical protein